MNDLHGPHVKWFRKLLRLREWECGSGNAEPQAAAPSPANGVVDESAGTAGSPATAEPQATADNREEEFAAADEAEDRADDPGDEFAAADERKDFARELADEFYEEADWPETGEGEDAAGDVEEEFRAEQREWAEADARREESLRDNSIALILTNWSPSRLELGDVPQIPEICDQLREFEERTELEMDNFRVRSLSPALLKRFRFSRLQQ